METKHVLVIQSRATGRFLLKETNDVWDFSVQMEWDREKAMLFALLHDASALFGWEDIEDYTVDYVGTYDVGLVFHVMIDDEPQATDDQSQWFALFDFPEPFNSATDSLFDSDEFMSRIVSPAY